MNINRKKFLKLTGVAIAMLAVGNAISCNPDAKIEKIEHIYTSMDSPDISKYEKIFFVQVNQNRCQGCHTCNDYCALT
jgi:MinD superfamily P-loop ATPase